VAITYFLNGIYVPFAHGLALSLLLWNSAPEGGAWPWGSVRKQPREVVPAATLPVPRGIRAW
jgi:hypothetical protein